MGGRGEPRQRRVAFALALAVTAWVSVLLGAPAGAGTGAGSLYFSTDVDADAGCETGTLYSLDTTDATAAALGATGVSTQTVGLTEGPDPTELLGSTFQDLSVIAADGSGFSLAGTNALNAEGLAFDPASSTLYSTINGFFFTANLTTGAPIDFLASAPDDLEGLAWRSADGRVYGYPEFSETLYAYTPGTNTWAAVGDTGIGPLSNPGLAWDPTLDVLYLVGYQLDDTVPVTRLWRVDPDTAAAELIGEPGLACGGGLGFIAPPTQPPPEPPAQPAFSGPAPAIVLEPTFTG